MAFRKKFYDNLSKVKLPKVSVPTLKRNKKGKKNGKEQKVQAPGEKGRIAAPDVTSALREVVVGAHGDYVIWLGQHVIDSLRTEEYLEKVSEINAEAIGRKLMAEIPDGDEKKQELERLLNTSGDDGSVEDALVAVKAALGEDVFNAAVGKIAGAEALEPTLKEGFEMPFKLLKNLGPKVVMTTNYGNFVLKHVGNDATSGWTSDVIEKEKFSIANLENEKSVVLSIQPELGAEASFGNKAFFAQFGLNKEGKPLAGEGKGTAVRHLLVDIMKKKPIVLLGPSQNEEKAFVSLFMTAFETKGKATLPKHIIYGSNDTRADAIKLVEFIKYEADKTHTQIWEFLAKLATNFAGHEKTESAYHSQAKYVYLSDLLDAETKANAVCMFNPIIPQMFKDLEKLGSLQTSTKDVLEQRVQILSKKLDGQEGGEENDFAVRLLMFQNALQKEIDAASEVESLSAIGTSFEHVIKLTEDFGAKFSIRLLPDTAENETFNKYELLYLPAAKKSDMVLAYPGSAQLPHFELDFIARNNEDCETAISHFEKHWTVALNTKKSVAFLKEKLDEIKAKETAIHEKRENESKASAAAEAEAATVKENNKGIMSRFPSIRRKKVEDVVEAKPDGRTALAPNDVDPDGGVAESHVDSKEVVTKKGGLLSKVANIGKSKKQMPPLAETTEKDNGTVKTAPSEVGEVSPVADGEKVNADASEQESPSETKEIPKSKKGFAGMMPRISIRRPQKEKSPAEAPADNEKKQEVNGETPASDDAEKKVNEVTKEVEEVEPETKREEPAKKEKKVGGMFSMPTLRKNKKKVAEPTGALKEEEPKVVEEVAVSKEEIAKPEEKVEEVKPEAKDVEPQEEKVETNDSNNASMEKEKKTEDNGEIANKVEEKQTKPTKKENKMMSKAMGMMSRVGRRLKSKSLSRSVAEEAAENAEDGENAEAAIPNISSIDVVENGAIEQKEDKMVF